MIWYVHPKSRKCGAYDETVNFSPVKNLKKPIPESKSRLCNEPNAVSMSDYNYRFGKNNFANFQDGNLSSLFEPFWRKPKIPNQKTVVFLVYKPKFVWCISPVSGFYLYDSYPIKRTHYESEIKQYITHSNIQTSKLNAINHTWESGWAKIFRNIFVDSKSATEWFSVKCFNAVCCVLPPPSSSGL